MSVLQFIVAILGLLACAWIVRHFITDAAIQMFGILICVFLLLVVILSFCGILPMLARA